MLFTKSILLVARTALALALPLAGCKTPAAPEDEPATAHAAPEEAHAAAEAPGAMAADHGTDSGHGAHAEAGADRLHRMARVLHGGHEAGRGRHPGSPVSELLGKVVPDFSLTDSTGKPFRLESLRRDARGGGKIAVLTFWCTTCSSCRMIEKDFEALAREHQGKDVRFFMLDSNRDDDAERVNRFLEQRRLSFPVLMDAQSEIARSFGATMTTTTAVIDAEGRLAYYGGYPGAQAAIGNLLAGDPVAVPTAPGGG